MTLVVIKPLDKAKWHGKKGKDAFGVPQQIEVLVDETTRKYATGIPDEAKDRLEKATGLNLSDVYIPDTDHPTWSKPEMVFKLENKTVVLDTTNPLNEIKVFNMKKSKFVANSMSEFEKGMWEDATHVIYDEEEEQEVKATKLSKRNKAIFLTQDMSDSQKIDLVMVLANRNVKGKKIEIINLEIDNLIETDVDKFIRYCNLSKDHVRVEAIVTYALKRNVLLKDVDGIYYMGQMIASDFNTTVQWFMNPQNATRKAAILETLNPQQVAVV